MNYPRQIQTWKGKLAYTIQWHIYLMDLGRGQIFGKVTQVFSEITAFMVVLKYFGFSDMSLGAILAVSIVIGVFLVWIAGYLYALFKLDVVQQLVISNRNPMLKEIHESISCGENGKRYKENI